MARFWAMTVALMRKNMAMTSSRGGLVWDAIFLFVAVAVMMNRACPDAEQGKTDGGHTSLGSCLLVYSILNSLGFGVVSRALTYEREKRIRDVLRAMGLRDGPYYVSWALWSLWKPLASATLVAAVATSKCGSHALGLPMLHVWLLMILGLLANLSLCFLIGVVCDSVQKGALLFMVLVLAPLYSVMYGMPWQMRLFLSYIPLYGMDSALLVSEVLGGGSVWATSKEHPYSFGYFLCMLAAEAVFGMLLALYLDQVLPRSWGAPPKAPLFFLRGFRSRRGSAARAREVIAGPASSSALLAEGFELQERLSDAVAPEGADSGALGPELHSVARCDQVLEEMDPMRGERIARGECVAIKNLRKVFVRGDSHLVAVDTLTLYLFPGEVLCLLGHNGAGKTTAISMLTGCLQPTQGNAFVFGRAVWGENSLVHNGEVGRYFGVCTQFNLMYSIMKLRLHIELICRIKGVGTDRVDELIDRFELRPHQHMEAMQLSGGTVRRMNLAMAFAGTAGTGKVIVLDEPTSGVDPQSRRRIWEAIRELKRDYTILLTTHYMDEADALSDQVCIMAEGHLRCMGSPHFLKQHFGCGYNLTLDHTGPAEPIVDVVRTVIGVEPARVESALLELRVPFSASPHFQELFRRLDSERSRLQIRNFGVSVTSVEDVFLRICSNRSLTSPGGLGDQSPSTPTANNAMESSTTRGRASLREQVFALVHFRQKLQRAGWAGAAMRIILPVAIWLVLFCMFNQTLKSIFPNKSARDIGIYKDLSRSITVFVVALYHCLASWFEVKQEDRDGIKRHLFSCGCSPWAYHMAHGISDGSLTGLSLILLLVIRRLGSVLDGGAQDTKALDPAAGYFSVGVFDAGSYWADFLICPLLGFLIAVWMPLLFLVARLETRNSDAPDKSQSAEVCSQYWLMAMCGAAMVGGGLFAQALEALHLVLAVPLCLVGTTLSPFLLLSLVAAGLPGAALLSGLAAAALRWLAAAALEVWLLSSPRGQLAYEQLRESCGMVCCLFLPMLCEFARGRLDPQAGREVLMDANAQEEAARVEAATAGTHKLEVSGVWKTYLTFKMGCFRSRERVTALRGVWFAADDEIFGLLGVNGAGKSSLLKIIIGQEYATEGHVSVRGSLGYCPQEDTLHARLTPWDHVELCGRLHGLSEERLVSEVAQLLDAFGLTECATQPVGHLSGGTKRRLMVCSAIIGSPDILVLDEPSCGVDPVTRRFMWRKMRSLAEARQILLTTHSMEEAEALCARVGILSGGVLRCVGSPQALKEHYGSGRWEVNVKLIPAEDDVQSRMAYGRQAMGLAEGVSEIPCASLAATAASLLGDPAGRRLMSAESSFPSLRDQLASRQAESSQAAGPAGTEAAPSGVTLEGLCRAYAAEAAGLALLDSCPFDYTLEEAEGMAWRLRVKLEETHCGTLFGWLEEQRAASGNFEHTVAQTTLEHVFMSIARSQEGGAGHAEA